MRSGPIEASDILGCWKLVRAYEDRDGDLRPNPYVGEGATGYLHYLAGGRVSLAVSLAGRKHLSASDRREAPMEELAESARTFDAYAGRFSFPEPGVIAHHIEISTFQNQVGTDLVREITLEGDTLTLCPVLQQGEPRRGLIWRRVS